MFQKLRQICRAAWAIIRAKDLNTIVIITPDKEFGRRIEQIQSDCKFSHASEVYSFSIQILEWATNKIRRGKYIVASPDNNEKNGGTVLYYDCFKHIPNSPYKKDLAFFQEDAPDWEDYINDHIDKPKE